MTEYVELSNGDVTVSLFKDGCNWFEDEVIDGEAPTNWGSMKYQSYLTPKELCKWMDHDYDGRWKVISSY